MYTHVIPGSGASSVVGHTPSDPRTGQAGQAVQAAQAAQAVQTVPEFPGPRSSKSARKRVRSSRRRHLPQNMDETRKNPDTGRPRTRRKRPKP